MVVSEGNFIHFILRERALTYIVSAGSAGSLGYLGWYDGRVSTLRYVPVASLPVESSVGSSIGILPAGHLVSSLGLPEQVEPAEVGASAVLVDVRETLRQPSSHLLSSQLRGGPSPLVVPGTEMKKNEWKFRFRTLTPPLDCKL